MKINRYSEVGQTILSLAPLPGVLRRCVDGSELGCISIEQLS